MDLPSLWAQEAKAYLAQGAEAYAYQNVLFWWFPLRPLFKAMPWLSAVALLSGAFLLCRARHKEPWAFLALVIFFHAAISAAAGFQDSRFVVPLLPIYWLLVIGGISSGLHAQRFFKTVGF